jgi:osmotically-inducible protein OsmY
VRDDEHHRARLVAALEDCCDVDSVDVRIEVDGGVVTVTGEVGSAAERLAVRTIVYDDPATQKLVDELHVAALPGEWRLPDSEITALVSARLQDQPELAAITPQCRFHIVQLDGVVADPADRRAAHHLARTTPGVHFVIDRIGYAAPRTSAARAERSQRRP